MSEVHLAFAFASTKPPVEQPGCIYEKRLLSESSCIFVGGRLQSIISIILEPHCWAKQWRVYIGQGVRFAQDHVIRECEKLVESASINAGTMYHNRSFYVPSFFINLESQHTLSVSDLVLYSWFSMVRLSNVGRHFLSSGPKNSSCDKI